MSFVESRNIILARLQWMSCPFKFRLIVDTCRFTLDAAREAGISFQVMCELAFIWFITFLPFLGESFHGNSFLGWVSVVFTIINLQLLIVNRWRCKVFATVLLLSTYWWKVSTYFRMLSDVYFPPDIFMAIYWYFNSLTGFTSFIICVAQHIHY